LADPECNNPILIADDGEIVAGHGRLAAAKLLDLETVPTLRLSHLTETERRAYVIADNKLALNAGWDREMLAIELQGLVDLDFEIELTGHVGGVARGINIPNVQPDAAGLATVNPIFTWVRLAQRVPVRIRVDQVPDGVRLVAGMTATVQIDLRPAVPVANLLTGG
jgi:hypothetical protein